MSVQSAAVTQQADASAPRSFFVEANGLRFCVEERGHPKGEPLILVMGLAAQMTLWPPALLDSLVAAGFRVIRFDNRDIGLSSEVQGGLQGSPQSAMLRYKLGMSVPAPYSLYDMAQDVVGLMDALHIDRAHLVGVSMGGMISQVLGSRYASRVRSLTLIMTSTNSPRLPTPDLKVIWHLQGAGIKGHHEEAAVARSLGMWNAIRSQQFPLDEDALRARILADYRRSYRPRGVLRQMRSIMGTGSLEPITRQIKVPTRIIHGEQDPLVKPAAARQLKLLIPRSDLHWMPGMAHDLPLPLLPELARLIVDQASLTAS